MVPFHPKKCAHLGFSISPAISVRSLDLWNIGCIRSWELIFFSNLTSDFYICSHSNGMWNDSSWLLYVTLMKFFFLKLGFLSWSVSDKKSKLVPGGPKFSNLVRGGPKFSNLVRGGPDFFNKCAQLGFLKIQALHTYFRPKSKLCTLLSDQNPSCAHLLKSFGPPRTKLENFGPPRTNSEDFCAPRTNLENFVPPRINLENFGPARTNLENVGPPRTKLDFFVW